MNPFLVLMFEGLVGIVFSFLLYLTPNYLQDIKSVFRKYDGWDIFLFIFLIILYIILSALRNAFKMITTKIYSPMIRNLTDNVLTPFYLIFYFCIGSDFQYEGDNFSINLILSIIISICSFIYCEFIVLFCCGLEKNTHDQISKRAETFGVVSIYDINKTDEESEIPDSISSLTDDKTERNEYSPFVLY